MGVASMAHAERRATLKWVWPVWLIVTCHCISRCVRRSRLFEQKKRRRALADRLVQLVLYFAIDVLEWALLTNHFHLVASTHPDLAALWSDREVVTRWRTLSPDYAWRLRNKIDKSLPAQPEEIAAALADPALIARWRRELAGLSTFHKFLKQRIARIINLEDDVTGQSRLNIQHPFGSPEVAADGEPPTLLKAAKSWKKAGPPAHPLQVGIGRNPAKSFMS